MISFAGSDPTSALFVIQGVTFNLISRVKKKRDGERGGDNCSREAINCGTPIYYSRNTAIIPLVFSLFCLKNKMYYIHSLQKILCDIN